MAIGYRTHEIPGWLSYTLNPGMAIVLRLSPLFGKKCLPLVDKVNYDRIFIILMFCNSRHLSKVSHVYFLAKKNLVKEICTDQ